MFTMISPCTTPIHLNPSIFTQNLLCTYSSGNDSSNNHELMIWISSFPLELIWMKVHNELGQDFLVILYFKNSVLDDYQFNELLEFLSLCL